MRTQDEIAERFMRKRQEFLNFEPEILVAFLDYEHAKPILKEGVTADEWGESRIPLIRETVVEHARTYMGEYGWDKCLNHRGISANRTVQKMEAWMWLLCDDEMVAVCQDPELYPQYGAPILKAICEKYGWEIPDDPAVDRMAAGKL
jgi:hypothetical protein